MVEYNPFLDLNPQFSYYRPTESPKVNNNIINNGLYGNISLPEDYTVIPRKSKEEKDDYEILAPVNPINWGDILSEMASTHEEPIQSSNTTNYTVKQDLLGNRKRAMDFFLSKGIKPHHAAGIVANLIGESNLNPNAINPTSGAFGTAQWLGSRKKKLFAKYGENPTFDLLLEFIWEELNGDEKSAFNRLLQTQSVDEAVNSFMQHFERPSKREMAQSISKRIKYGKELLA